MSTEDETVKALTWKIRQQTEKIIKLEAKVKADRADSLLNAELFRVKVGDLERQNAWLQDQLPRWWERPTFVVPVVVVVTMWVVLRVVAVSV